VKKFYATGSLFFFIMFELYLVYLFYDDLSYALNLRTTLFFYSIMI